MPPNSSTPPIPTDPDTAEAVWVPWFAWHPVVVFGKLVWLQHVERKSNLDVPHVVSWEYRFLRRKAEFAALRESLRFSIKD